jgi:membrane-associated phospholipid phosphatase
MTSRRVVLALAFLAVSLPASAQHKPSAAPVEPTAGEWRTWVITSGKDYRVAPPPAPQDTQAELRALAELISQNDENSAAQIAFWNAGAPQYRWMDLISNRLLASTPTTAIPHRVYTYVALAMYDATIATWESKYHYARARPSEMDKNLLTAVDVPNSPSYPSEHAAAAQAAATVLAHFLPAEAQTFQTMAEQAAWSRVLAGVQFPSDYDAGLALGRKVAEQVIAKAQADGSDAVFTGSIPAGPCNWKGTNPMGAAAVNWAPLLLSSPGEFRPSPPPACDSQQVKDETAIVRNTPRGPTAFATNAKAFYWQSPEGLNYWGFRYLDKWLFEDGLDQNPPRAARAYALMTALQFDAFIASQDGKFAYWYIRPSQLDPAIVPLFPVPNHPGYPSNHSTFSASKAEMLAYLFPTRADYIRAIGKEAGDSRIWGGIHFPMDNVAGNTLGKAVAGVFIEWARNDGSQ